MTKKASRRKAVSFEAIIQSLQSKERNKIYHYLLLIYPAWATIAEIEKGVQSDYKNVKGALKGDDTGYSKRLALLKVGMVEHKMVRLSETKVNLYRAKRRNSVLLA